jgi:hypothetical protein
MELSPSFAIKINLIKSSIVLRKRKWLKLLFDILFPDTIFSYNWKGSEQLRIKIFTLHPF